jgi:hypothetical protein
MWHEKLVATFHIGPTCWLSVFALSLLLTSHRCFQLVFGRQNIAWERLGLLATALVACVLVADEVMRCGREAAHFIDPLLSLTTIGLLIVGSVVHWKWTRMEFVAGRFVRGTVIGLLVACSAGAASWSIRRFYEAVAPPAQRDGLGIAATPGWLCEVSEYVALTDRDREVPLFRWGVDTKNFPEFLRSSDRQRPSGSEASIPRSAASAQSNCHGWIFTGGQFLMRGSAVERILADNGYHVVPRPRSGDLIVYRDDQDLIVHTGLVRGILDDGTVIVESKWELDGRYLHLPEIQPYAEHFDYYRSSRPGHLLRIARARRARLADRVAFAARAGASMESELD